MQVLEMLRSRVTARRATAAETLVAAAARAAAGENVDPGSVEKALFEAGHTVDDFAAMVELATKRSEWRKAWAKHDAAAGKLQKAQATGERERAQFEKVRTAWLERAREIDVEIRNATKTVDAARAARAELVNPRNVPSAYGVELSEAHAALDAEHARVGGIERELREARDIERQQREWAEHKRNMNTTNEHGGPEDHELRADRAARRAKELEAELKDAQKRVDVAAGRVQSLEDAATKL